MTRLTNIQHVISNIPSVEKIHQVHQQQTQAEQARLAAQNQKTAENRGRTIEDAAPLDKVDINVKGDQSGSKRRGNKKKDSKDHSEVESGDDKLHIDIRI